jgi:hypothetical protein
LSPLPWNLVADRLLTVTNDLGFSTFGYADDIVITVQGKFAHTVREIMQKALNVVAKWAAKEGLNISPHKTAIVPFTNRRKLEGLGPLIPHGKELNVIIDADYWRNKDPMFPEDVLVWYTDGSRTVSGTGSGIYGLRRNRSYCFPSGKYATVFQTEIYAILQCAYENIKRAYKNKQILIFSDSQAALKALSGPKVISRLVAECLNALSALANLNELTLIWVPGHTWQ